MKTALAKVLVKSLLQRFEELADCPPPGKASANGRQIIMGPTTAAAFWRSLTECTLVSVLVVLCHRA